MGLFKFLKNVGADLFKRGNEAGEITTLLNERLGEKLSDLNVAYEDGTVFLSGAADSQATKEKAVLLAGNVNGVNTVEDDGITVPKPEVEAEEEKDEPLFYTIRRGDSLSKIAKAHYGNAMKYPFLFEANREVIKNPDLIYPGQVIRIPKLEETAVS